VEIEVIGINVTDLNMTQIRSELSNLTNINEDDLRIRVNVDENDNVVSIIVFTTNRTTADTIGDAVNNKTSECKDDESSDEDERFIVEIEVEGMNASSLSESEIANSISNLTGLSDDDLRIRVDIEEGQVSRVFVVVKDWYSAFIVLNKIRTESLKCRQSATTSSED